MTIYTHVKTDHIMPGLPAGDLDENALTDEQRQLLVLAVERGIYRAMVEPVDRPDYHQNGWASSDREEADDAETAGN